MNCLIYLLIIGVCHAFTQSYRLLLHETNSSIENGIPLAKFELGLNTETNVLSASKLRLFDYPKNNSNINDSNHWCLSLITESNELKFECFNYFTSLNFIDQERIKLVGELSINLNTNGDEVNDVTFYPLSIDMFRVKLNKVFKLCEPQLRLSLNPNQEESTTNLLIKPKKEVESKEKSRNKKDKVEKPKIIDDSYEYDKEMKEFQEIVKPRGLYSENQTFIERYWVYIVPPAVIIFVVGNIVVGN